MVNAGTAVEDVCATASRIASAGVKMWHGKIGAKENVSEVSRSAARALSNEGMRVELMLRFVQLEEAAVACPGAAVRKP